MKFLSRRIDFPDGRTIFNTLIDYGCYEAHEMYVKTKYHDIKQEILNESINVFNHEPWAKYHQFRHR